jgi:hypothetical protein
MVRIEKFEKNYIFYFIRIAWQKLNWESGVSLAWSSQNRRRVGVRKWLKIIVHPSSGQSAWGTCSVSARASFVTAWSWIRIKLETSQHEQTVNFHNECPNKGPIVERPNRICPCAYYVF